MQMRARLAVMLGVVVPTPGERILERQRLSIPTAAQRQARPWKDTQAGSESFKQRKKRTLDDFFAVNSWIPKFERDKPEVRDGGLGGEADAASKLQKLVQEIEALKESMERKLDALSTSQAFQNSRIQQPAPSSFRDFSVLPAPSRVQIYESQNFRIEEWQPQ